MLAHWGTTAWGDQASWHQLTPFSQLITDNPIELTNASMLRGSLTLKTGHPKAHPRSVISTDPESPTIKYSSCGQEMESDLGHLHSHLLLGFDEGTYCSQGSFFLFLVVKRGWIV